MTEKPYILSLKARDDSHHILVYVAKDNVLAAENFFKKCVKQFEFIG